MGRWVVGRWVVVGQPAGAPRGGATAAAPTPEQYEAQRATDEATSATAARARTAEWRRRLQQPSDVDAAGRPKPPTPDAPISLGDPITNPLSDARMRWNSEPSQARVKIGTRDYRSGMNIIYNGRPHTIDRITGRGIILSDTRTGAQVVVHSRDPLFEP